MVVVTAAAAGSVAAAEHFHFVGNDVVGGAFDAVFAGVFAALDAAFDINLAALFQILAGDFGQAAVHGDVVPLGALLALAALAVVPSFGSGDGEIAHRFAVGHVAHFGITAEIADQDDFV